MFYFPRFPFKFKDICHLVKSKDFDAFQDDEGNIFFKIPNGKNHKRSIAFIEHHLDTQLISEISYESIHNL